MRRLRHGRFLEAYHGRRRTRAADRVLRRGVATWVRPSRASSGVARRQAARHEGSPQRRVASNEQRSRGRDDLSQAAGSVEVLPAYRCVSGHREREPRLLLASWSATGQSVSDALRGGQRAVSDSGDAGEALRSSRRAGADARSSGHPVRVKTPVEEAALGSLGGLHSLIAERRRRTPPVLDLCGRRQPARRNRSRRRTAAMEERSICRVPEPDPASRLLRGGRRLRACRQSASRGGSSSTKR